MRGAAVRDDFDAGYLPQLRRSEGQSDVQHGAGC